MPGTINFYHETETPYGCFSNFAAYPIELRGKTWPTSEHFFQAQKFSGTAHEEEIRRAPTPGEAARLGHQPTLPLRSDWEKVKEDIMREALWAKFTQHPQLAQLLRDTGDAILVEHTRNDRYWADGGDGSGLNRLGHLLMEIRGKIRQG